MLGRPGKWKGITMEDHFYMRVLLDEYGDVCLQSASSDILAFGIPLSIWLKKVPENNWDPNSSELSDFLEKKKFINATIWKKLTTSYKEDKKFQVFLKDYLNKGDEPYIIEHLRIDLKNKRCGCPMDYHFVYMLDEQAVVISKRDVLPLLGSDVIDIPLAIMNLDQAHFIRERAIAKLDRENTGG